MKPKGAALALFLGLAFLLAPAARCQSDQMVHVKSFPGVTVGDKVSAAMEHCPSAGPCILVIDASMAAYAEGTMPALCAQCSVRDYRSGSISVSRGSAAEPAAVVSPLVGATVSDDNTGVSTPVACGRSPVGVGAVNPFSAVCATEYGINNGSSVPVGIYTDYELGANASDYLIGNDMTTTAQGGSLPIQVAQDFVTADNSGWNIGACTLSSGVDTCTVSGTPISPAMQAALVGNGLFISGNTAGDTGGGICVITAAAANSITCNNTNQGGSAGPVTGGWMAPNHLAWGIELNTFNNNHDPGIPTPVSAENVTEFHGITSTGSGNFPLTDDFFADGANYNGFWCADSRNACFVAGDPTQGNGTLSSTVGFIARPYGVAVAGTNYPSLRFAFDSSIWNGSSYSETQNFIRRIPVSNATGALGELLFETPSASFGLLDNGQLMGVSGCANPAYSFAGAPATGLCMNAGIAALSVNGVPILQAGTQGASVTGYVTVNGAKFNSGSGAPTGSCNIGDLFTNQAATTASTVLYLCYPANTWNAVSVP